MMSVVKISMKIYLIGSTRALYLLWQVRACMLFTRCMCYTLIYLYMFIKTHTVCSSKMYIKLVC